MWSPIYILYNIFCSANSFDQKELHTIRKKKMREKKFVDRRVKRAEVYFEQYSWQLQRQFRDEERFVASKVVITNG